MRACNCFSGRVMERGTLSVQADGSVVRDISAHYSAGVPLPPRGEQVTGPEGAIVQFRQTFSASGPDRVLTSVIRRDGERWVPTFPGSDRLVMTRRNGSAD